MPSFASLAVADFNGDGKLDLVGTTRTGVDVLLGNGDGTFSSGPGSPIDLGTGTPGAIAVGDFSGDGKHVHRRVLQHKNVNARAHRTAIVPFLFAFP